MKVSFIVPTKNKAKDVERAANSYLRQTYSPMEIVFFDQASTDGTLEILQDLAGKYDGPNTVRILNCPPHQGGAAGMNADIKWVHDQIEGDVILWGNSDDFAYSTRTAKTVKVFEEHNPSWVSCCQFFMDEKLVIQGETQIPNKKDRKVEFAEAVRFQIGSSGALAYARDLWEKHGPMRGIEQNDIVLPLMSFLERGMWFIAEPLHTYVFHASPDNQGIGGRLLAASSESEKMQLEETNAFNLVSNWISVIKRLEETGAIQADVSAELNQRLWGCAQAWEAARRALTLANIRPLGLHMKAEENTAAGLKVSVQA